MDFRIDATDLRDALTEAIAAMPPTLPRRPTDDADDGGARWARLCADGWFDAFVPAGTDDRTWMVRGLTVAEALGAHPAPEPLAATVGFLLPLLAHLSDPRAAAMGRAVRDGTLTVALAPGCLGADGRPLGGWAGDDRAPVIAAHAAGGVVTGVLRGVMVPPGARLLVLPARTPDGATMPVGVPLERDGVTVVRHGTVVPGRTVADVTLTSVAVTEDDVLADAGPGTAAAIRWAAAAHGRLLDGLALGGGQAVLDRTLAYVAQREQFGALIGSFQAVKHQVADAAVLLEGARSLAYVAAWEADRNGPDAAAATLAASRLNAATMYRRVAETGIQLRGATGFTWEDGAHRWLRAALFDGGVATDRAALEASFAPVLGGGAR